MPNRSKYCDSDNDVEIDGNDMQSYYIIVIGFIFMRNDRRQSYKANKCATKWFKNI